MNNIIPLEDEEAITLAEWLRLKKYKFSHIANESGQKWTYNIIKMMKKKKDMWMSSWVPDFMIILKRWSLLFLELKRKKKRLKNWELWTSVSIVSKEQREWIKKLEEINNVGAEIAYWALDAINIIEFYEKN